MLLHFKWKFGVINISIWGSWAFKLFRIHILHEILRTYAHVYTLHLKHHTSHLTLVWFIINWIVSQPVKKNGRSLLSFLSALLFIVSP